MPDTFFVLTSSALARMAAAILSLFSKAKDNSVQPEKAP
jgi:hypothetical protein